MAELKSRLIINNFGPIKKIDILINKINVIIGKQSSGKSTIVKILSFCQWVEKRYLIEGKFNHSIEERLQRFHRIDNDYFNADTHVIFESEAVIISFDHRKKITITEKDKKKYLKTKNLYIPAERNFAATIPNLGRYNESSDNIMNFIYDWNEARNQCSNPKNILTTGVSYSYNEEDDEDNIHFVTDSGEQKNIPLRLSSSGLQSVVPLIVLFDYLTDSFYKVDKPHSLFEKMLIERLKSDELESLRNQNMTLEDIKKEIMRLNLSNISEYHFSRFIIEEPELNLYPETQKEMIYYFFHVLSDSNHQLTITTHSPFILYSINNCMMGKLIQDKMPDDEQEILKSRNSWIDPELVSVWQIENGTLQNLIQEDTKLIGPHSFDVIMRGVMGEYFEMLGYFGDEN